MTAPILFLTGATGFIGHHLLRAASSAGWRVRALVRPGSDPELLWRVDGAEPITGDLLDAEAMAAGCAGAEAVVHCAAQVGVTDRETDIWEINVEGTLRLLRAAADAGVRRAIHLSTGGVLGPVGVHAADGATPLNPGNTYARSKAESERRAWALSAATGLPLAIVRPPMVYGPGDLRTLGLFQAVKSGWPMPWRTDVRTHPVAVEDFCAGILACLDAFPRPAGQTYHLAGPRPVPMREFIAAIAAGIGASPPPHLPMGLFMAAARVSDRIGGALDVELPLTRRRLHVFAYANAFSLEDARRDFGYAPSVELEAGLSRAAAWYRENGLL